MLPHDLLAPITQCTWRRSYLKPAKHSSLEIKQKSFCVMKNNRVLTFFPSTRSVSQTIFPFVLMLSTLFLYSLYMMSSIQTKRKQNPVHHNAYQRHYFTWFNGWCQVPSLTSRAHRNDCLQRLLKAIYCSPSWVEEEVSARLTLEE